MNMCVSLAIGIALKLRQNWRQEAALLPAPVRLVGFTLIELSIVLVIIGLIAGGILVGYELIHQASLRNIMKDFSRLEYTMGQFKEKYQYLPGDMPNATTVLGATGNGNGDKRIYGTGETRRVLEHASLSELLGETVGYNEYAQSSYKKSVKIQFSAVTVSTWPIDKSTGQYLYSFVTDDENPNTISSGYSYQPPDAHKIDKKFDDGIANTGILTSNTHNHCYDSSSPNAEKPYRVKGNYIDEFVCELRFFTHDFKYKYMRY